MKNGMWFADDIGNVLRGIALAIAAPYMGAERTSTEAAAFREGFMAALSSVALALGIADEANTRRERTLSIHHRAGAVTAIQLEE